MKLKSLLFGSAAAVMAVTGAQAAEPLLPVAEPVDYVRICDAFGTGFFYIPGTDTCLKIGGYVRADYVYNHSFEDVVVFDDDETGLVLGEVIVDPDGRNRLRVADREDRNFNEFGTRARARLTFDTRVQTDIGLIRTYTDLWFHVGPMNGRDFDTTGGRVTFREFFIQIANDWGTLTFGRAASFFEFYEGDAWATRGLGEDAPLSPLNLAAVTFNLGGGVSASVSLEDSATDGDRRLGDARPAFFPVDLNEDGIPDALGLRGGGFPVNRFGNAVTPTGLDPFGNNGIHGGNRAPDVVANVRVDQAWGSAQIMGALHPIRARAFTGPDLNRDLEPDTEFGWAVGAGATFDILATGIAFSIQGVYADGAPGYATDRGQVGALSDAFVVGTFTPPTAAGACGVVPAGGGLASCGLVATDIDTVEAWSVKAGIGGDLAPDWIFNLQGTFARVDNPENLGRPVGRDVNGNVIFAAGPAAVQSTVFTTAGLEAGPTFSGDFDHWTASGHVAWTPVAGFLAGVELAYERVEFDAGPETDIWGGVARVQKSF